ncbi:unnamed protein product [Euphydryas editha]|uniref:Endonuclease/exonuclease/phosphatase domain-containing protein n=1 Tax=Euphydryas editha TaxID=104508 RepID=A0AAU9UIJ2_EUPED|nr:unnamed protein product [Euphydryas editha]
MSGSRKLKIGFLNPGSLGSRHDEFIYAMDKHNVDLMAINETWLKQGEEGRAPHVPGYRLRHIPRPDSLRSRGGGVGYYIRNGLSARTHTHPTSPMVEQMWLNLKVSDKRIFLGTAYRPPWLSVRVFLDALTETICSLPGCDYTILVGDFNINYLNTTHHHTHMLEEFLTIHKMKQHTKEPTHFTSESETLLDLVCSNAKLDRVWVDYIPDLSHHALITFNINAIKDKIAVKKIVSRDIKNIDQSNLKEAIETIDCNSIAHITDVDSMVGVFTDSLLWVFDLLAPLKTKVIKQHKYPWITYNVRLMMREH